MPAITLYIGLDVHKDSITIAIAQSGRNGEIRLFGTIANSLHALEKMLARIRKAHPGARLEIAYEAGPCGFGIARRLKQLGVPCLVAAPSLIPKQPGSPFKNDKRDRPTPARRRTHRRLHPRADRRSHARSLPCPHRCGR